MVVGDRSRYTPCVQTNREGGSKLLCRQQVCRYRRALASLPRLVHHISTHHSLISGHHLTFSLPAFSLLAFSFSSASRRLFSSMSFDCHHSTSQIRRMPGKDSSSSPFPNPGCLISSSISVHITLPSEMMAGTCPSSSSELASSRWLPSAPG